MPRTANYNHRGYRLSCQTNHCYWYFKLRPHKFAIATKCRLTEAEKAEKDALKKAKQAEAARMRYHRLSPEEKKALNLRRTYAQKRKRQRERELAELEIILRCITSHNFYILCLYICTCTLYFWLQKQILFSLILI